MRDSFLSNRKSVILLLLILVCVIFATEAIRSFSLSPETKKKNSNEVIKPVLVFPAEKRIVIPEMYSQGIVKSIGSVTVKTQVSGAVLPSKKRFREGMVFKKGEVLLALNSDLARLRLNKAKSNYISKLTRVVAELAVDYPDQVAIWSAFLNKIDFDKALPDLPKLKDDRFRVYFSSRGVVGDYFDLKILEETLGYHVVRAPFKGTVRKSFVAPGDFVTMGVPLGEFVSLDHYELDLFLTVDQVKRLREGLEVKLFDVMGNPLEKGRIAKIGKVIDKTNQMVQVLCYFESKHIYDGLSVKAVIYMDAMEDVVLLNRNLLQSDQSLFIVQGDALDLLYPKVDYIYKDKAIVKDIPQGALIVKYPFKGAYKGQKVEVLKDKLDK